MASKCSICSHPDRNQIDQLLLQGASLRDLEARFGVSRSALSRHKKEGHITQQVVKAHEVKEAADADTLLKIMESLLSECLKTIKTAKGSTQEIEGKKVVMLPDETLKLKAIKEARDTARVLLEVQGRIPPETEININIIENQWVEFRTAIIQTLCPECQKAVVALLKKEMEY